MDLGYQILEPSCDFLELLGFWMGQQKPHLTVRTGKIEGESMDPSILYMLIICSPFFFFGVFFGGTFWGFIFGNPFRSDFAIHLQKSPGKISLNNKGTFTYVTVVVNRREVLECHGCEWPMLGTSSEFRLRCIIWGGTRRRVTSSWAENLNWVVVSKICIWLIFFNWVETANQ